jgi:tetratricopeptide (TPR) repeat protein
MPKRKLAKEIEIIEPGKLLSLWRQLQHFIEQNIRQVAAVGLIIVVLAGGIGFWQYKNAQAEEDSYALFFTAMNRYNSSDKPAGSKDAAPANDENSRQALQEFKKITAQYPDTSAGKAALFYAGACSYDLKKDEDALSCYQEFLKKTAGEQNYLRPATYEGIGYVYERKGDFKQAIEWFEKQKSDASDSLNMMAPLNLARCYAALGEREKACTSYKEFTEKYPSSSFAEAAKTGISEFCASTEQAAAPKPSN